MATSATYVDFLSPDEANDAEAGGNTDEAVQGLPYVPIDEPKPNRPSSEHNDKTKQNNDDHSSEQDSAVAMDSTDKARSSMTIEAASPPPYPGVGADTSTPPACRPPSSQERDSFSSSRTSADRQGVRVRTKGNDLKSGFPYHPRLYDLRVRPDDWQRFSKQLTDATRFTRGDYARMWAAAGSVALTGAVLTTTWVGRTVNRSIQEQKVSKGLIETSEDSLGGILAQWNQSYFAPLGLQAKLELSDSAMRRPEQKSKIFRRPSLMYRNREDRERKNEDRKFVIVVTELANDSNSTGVQELMGDSVRAGMPVPAEPQSLTSELHGDARGLPIELPTANDQVEVDKDQADALCGLAELPADVPMELAESPVKNREPATQL